MKQITAVMYQATKDGEFKPGLLIDDGKTIIAEDGSLPLNVWDYHKRASFLSISIGPIFEAMKSLQKAADK